ncbi:MAG: rhomboid family intramembrane serine protease [Clostridiales bacterium]|nr:rhomboid family intramembrane serine protease [Candidatus Blautia equi]
MLACGACFTPGIVEHHEYYRLFTSMFLHFGIQHLVNNMLVLFVLGGRLEHVVGKIRFLLIYLLGGLCGNILSCVVELAKDKYAISAGASGATFAILGALVFLLIKNQGRVEDLSSRQIAVMLILSLYMGFTSTGVDNMAHIGGVLGGFLTAFATHLVSVARQNAD